VERLKAWLSQNGISIVYPGIGSGGLITLRLHPSSGADFEVAFYPDDLEADPDDAIEFIKNLLARRRLSL
jgi:hypothetical protein